MNITDFVKKRQESWNELEKKIESLSKVRLQRNAKETVEFAALYRAACADLALSSQYRLPQDTVRYLHQLVARAHNILYRSQRFQWRTWGRILFHDVPHRLLTDRYLWLALALFWGSFLGSGFIAFIREDFAVQIAGEDSLEAMEQMYAEPMTGRDEAQDTQMAGFYIFHNTGIGLRCFAMGLLLGVGSMYELVFNGVFLGTIFGYMATTPNADHFFEFVTAHCPFELTAVALSAAAGFRMGFSVLDTRGLSRYESLLQQSRQALEVVLVAAVLFIFAAFIEGYVSPSALPYPIKVAVAIGSAILLIVYVVVLGTRGAPDAA